MTFKYYHVKMTIQKVKMPMMIFIIHSRERSKLYSEFSKQLDNNLNDNKSNTNNVFFKQQQKKCVRMCREVGPKNILLYFTFLSDENFL